MWLIRFVNEAWQLENLGSSISRANLIQKNDCKFKPDLFNRLYFLRYNSHNDCEEVFNLHFIIS